MRWFHEAHGLRYLSLRYFNAAGADAEGEYGEDHEPETHLIPLVLEAAAARRPEVQIHGTDYPTPDGTCVRDYIHVTDLASAHVMGLEALMGGRVESQAINLGTGSGYSVREVIEAARRITGKDFFVSETARRPGDPPTLIAAVDRAKKVLGWTAVESGLENIIRSAWNWASRRRSKSDQFRNFLSRWGGGGTRSLLPLGRIQDAGKGGEKGYRGERGLGDDMSDLLCIPGNVACGYLEF